MSDQRLEGHWGASPAGALGVGNHGRQPRPYLYLARAAWLLIGVPAVALLILSLPSHYRALDRGYAGIIIERSGNGEIVISGTNLNARRAGIQRGDVLIAIDGVPIGPEETVRQIAFERMRGAVGTVVQLTVARPGEATRDYTVVRSQPEMEVLRRFGFSVGGVTGYNFIMRVLPSIAFILLAFAIAWHGRRNPLGWLLSLGMLLMALLNISYWGATAALVRESPALTLPNHVIESIAISGVVLVLCLFPDGRWAPRWTRLFALIAVGWFLTAPWNPLMEARHAWLFLNVTMVKSRANRPSSKPHSMRWRRSWT